MTTPATQSGENKAIGDKGAASEFIWGCSLFYTFRFRYIIKLK